MTAMDFGQPATPDAVPAKYRAADMFRTPGQFRILPAAGGLHAGDAARWITLEKMLVYG